MREEDIIVAVIQQNLQPYSINQQSQDRIIKENSRQKNKGSRKKVDRKEEKRRKKKRRKRESR